MSDDARIARLTELARKAWQGREVNVDTLIHIADHPRMLDALEAALLVLAGDAPLVAAGQGAMSKLAEPAWVERLAAQWEREALEPPPETVRTAHPPYLLRVALQECAKELRARAKGSP